MSYSGDLSKRKIYVGNLPPEIRHRDLDDLFYKYGKIVDIDIKDRKKPPFAFIEFDDPRDAEDAVTGRNGYNYDGYRLRVEFPRGNQENHGQFSGGRPKPDERTFTRNKTSGPSRRSEFRVFVSGLPPTGSWQDLKDHMREAGDVGHADVFRDGTGVCEFLRIEDMKYAMKHLDDTKFKSHEGEISYIRVEEDRGGKVKSRSRSKSRSYKIRVNGRQTPTYSPMRRSSPTYSNYSRSRSRSRT